jgi:hypothetical protein
MNITLKIDGQCPSGGHIYITPIKNGVPQKQRVYNKAELWGKSFDVELEEVFLFLVRTRVRKYFKINPTATLSNIKAMIEAEEFEI